MALTYNISSELISLYSKGPSQARTRQVKDLHESIRQALENWGDGEFDTFLQGSYRNSTAISDINDVDIVALHDPSSSPAFHREWVELFKRVSSILKTTNLVSGAVRLGDKCVKLDGSLKADIVPAISPRRYSSENPIRVYSLSEMEERNNFPRTHYVNGVSKQEKTADAYKPTVRMFKRWKRQYTSFYAPSFYIECAVHSVHASKFDDYLPLSFASVAVELLGYTSATRIPSVAGNKDILTSAEWPAADFADFQRFLAADTRRVFSAMEATTQYEADRLWKLVFGD